MTLRPPRLSARVPALHPFDALQYEIVQEQASTLGRLGRRLESALKALAEFDAANTESRPSAHAARVAFVDAASRRLWELIVQREACGLRDAARVLRDYDVPPEVQARMGAGPRRDPP